MAKNRTSFSKTNQPANKGRRPGTMLSTQLRVSSYLNDNNISPAKEIHKLIMSGELNAAQQLQAWELLLQYCQPKFSPQPVQIVAVNNGPTSTVSQAETGDLVEAVLIDGDSPDDD